MRVFNSIIPARNPLLTGLVVFLLTVALTQSLSYQRHLIRKDEKKSEVLREINAVKDRLKAAMSNDLSAVKTLGFIVEKYGVPEKFDEVARRILESNKNIDALELTKGGVITHIYPLQGNENVIGYNVLADSLRRREALKAIEKNELFFAGPLVLKQGGVAIIGRLPVYRNNEFEGFSVAIVKLSTLLKAVGIDTIENKKFIYQLSKINSQTLKEEFFLPHSMPFTTEQCVSVEIPDGGWKLYVMPREETVFSDVVVFSILGFILSILCGALAFYLARQPYKLKNLVEEKTAEIIKIYREKETVLNSISESVISVDREWRYTYINDIAIAKHASTREETLGRVIWEVHPEMLGTEFEKKYREAMETGKLVEMESYYSFSRTWFTVKVYPSADGLTIFYRDITAEKKAAHEISLEKSFSESILNSLPGIFYLYDRDGKFMRWNKNFETITGYTAEEIRLMHPLDFFDVTEKPLLKKQIDTVFENGMADVEAFLFTKEKTKIPYYFNGHLVKLDEEDYLIGVGIDITERNKAQKELRESETRLADAQEVAKIGSWETNLADLSVIWSKQTYDIFEVNASGMNTSHISFLNYVHPEDKEKVDAAFVASLGSTGVHSVEHRIITANGNIKYIEERWRIIHDKDNKPFRAIGTCQDITERKNTETALKESHDNIRMLHTHLQTIREDERTSIAREIHDELGQQLTGLKMDASWLVKKIAPAEKAQQQKLSDMIALIDNTVKTVRRISSDLRPGILDDLGLIAALEWQSGEFEKRTGIKCNFTSNVNEVILEKKLVTGIFRIYQEALTNVMRHAKATIVTGSIEQTETHLILTIQDNGAGFDIKHENSNKTLGLIGMKERALMLDSELNIESEKGRGTVVVLRIPCNTISS